MGWVDVWLLVLDQEIPSNSVSQKLELFEATRVIHAVNKTS